MPVETFRATSHQFDNDPRSPTAKNKIGMRTVDRSTPLFKVQDQYLLPVI